MRREKIISHRLMNWFHTVLLFGGMLLLLAVLGLSLAGTSGLFWAMIAGFVLLAFSQRFSPQWILRMNGARRLSSPEAPGLYRIVEELSRRAKLDAVPRLYYLPSPIMNAFAVGQRDEAAIGITDGMLRQLNSRELAGILAHEISHIRQNDIQVMGFANIVSRITSLFSTFGQLLLFFNLPLLLMGRTPISWFAILLLIAAPTLSGLLQLALSRTREFNADLGAVRLTGDPEGLATALQKLEHYQTRGFRSIFFPGYQGPESSLFRTHPKTSERVERLMDVAGIQHQPRMPEPEVLYRNPYGYPNQIRKPRWYRLGVWN